MSRVVVVGAGLGGLAAAARLAAAGHQVSVYERGASVGGKLGTYARDGFRFDTGPGLLTLPHVFAELFGATGGKMPFELVELDPIGRHVFADGSVLDSCANPADFAHRIVNAYGPRAALDWHRLWLRAHRVWRASWEHVLTSSVTPGRLARLATRLGDLAAVAPGRTLRGLGRAYLRDPHLRMMLDRYATYTGSDPRRAPAALVAVPYAELRFGGWYLPGGLARLASALLDRCTDLGVAVHTGAEVTAIEAGGGRVHGVRLAGSARVGADVVVAAVDAQHLYRDLLPDPGRLAGLRDRSLAGFVLLLGLRGTTPELAHHTVFFPERYDDEFDAVFGEPRPGVGRRPARPVADPTVFVTRAEDPAVRPDGHESLFVMVNAARHGRPPAAVDWRAPGLADRYADHVLDVLARRGPDVRDRVLFREIRTPADLPGAPDGAIYGTAGHGLLRPANLGPVRGLYLVGGSTHPGGGLPLVALSAKIVTNLIGPAS